MEWLWEMNDILDDDGGEDSDGEADNDDNEDSGGKGSGIPDDLSLKRLYLYLYEKTTPTYAMDAEFMSLGNRRCIWRPCQQLAELQNAVSENLKRGKRNAPPPGVCQASVAPPLHSKGRSQIQPTLKRFALVYHQTLTAETDMAAA
ncbi:hypothetical protein RJZ57_002910 [Blastomyces gilchristii]